jgi:tetratricopeptide (TPR) repeat protein
MDSELFLLQVCEFDNGGQGQYRFHEPSRALARLPGVLVIDCDPYHRLLPALAEAADVLLLQGHDSDLFPLLERRRAAGRVTVLEVNDNYYDLQAFNPHARRWLERSVREELRYFLGAVDAVQTSSEDLARRWRAHARQVAVFPNQLVAVPPLPPVPQRPLTLGWGSSAGHLADWFHLAPALRRWLDAHPDVHLAVMADDVTASLFDLPPERFRRRPIGTLADYYQFLTGLDIGLAPLLPSDFNRGRTDVKFLEFAAHGVAGLYADLEPYRDSVVRGQTGLLFGTPAELCQGLDLLASDAALRQHIRRQAHAHVAARRRLDGHVGERLAFYRGLLPGPPRGLVLSDEFRAAAVVDHTYLRLLPQVPERALRAALEAPDGAVSSLRELVEKWPDYAAALQHLGRLLNDRREPRAVLAYLERALALTPDSAFTLSEIGRARFGLGDATGARTSLERALALNPRYQPAWHYFLRLLSLTPDEDSRRWAQKCRALHPGVFTLSLAAARLYSGEEAIPFLQELLDQHAPSLAPEERPAAACAFSQAIADVTGPLPASGAAVGLLRSACEAFPESARLADLLGWALRHAGCSAEADAQFLRALGLRRLAATYRAEFPREDATQRLWEAADYAQRWLGTQVAL